MGKLPSAVRASQSYLAARPLSAKLHSVEKGDELSGIWRIVKSGHAITGELGRNTTEIFSNPAGAIQDFANTGGRPEDVLHFTRRYGALRRNDRHWFETTPGEEVAGDRFMVHCGQWQQKQEEFRAEWERTEKRDADLAETISKRISPRAFVLPGKGRGFQLEVRPDDLLGALWLAFLGYSSRTRKCQNPTCVTPYFIAARQDQKYCTEVCSRLVANRTWWAKRGAQWRAKKMKERNSK
jgi:hypothetical protein